MRSDVLPRWQHVRVKIPAPQWNSWEHHCSIQTPEPEARTHRLWFHLIFRAAPSLRAGRRMAPAASRRGREGRLSIVATRVTAGSPQICVQRAPHLAIEAVDAVHALGLVVAARQVQVARQQGLVRQQRQDDLHRERPPVHKVACRDTHTGTRAISYEDAGSTFAKGATAIDKVNVACLSKNIWLSGSCSAYAQAVREARPVPKHGMDSRLEGYDSGSCPAHR